MSKVIIGVHGLGNKPSKKILKDWWLKAMKEGLDNIGMKDLEIPQFELVYWADVLNVYPLSQKIKDKSDPYYLKEYYTTASKNYEIEDHSTRLKVVNYLSDQLNKIFLNDDFSLNYSFISDAILHQYFQDLEVYFSEICDSVNAENCLARNVIQNRLVKTLDKYKYHQVMLIGHSMGSIIAYDVLSFALPNASIDTFITIGSPLGLPPVISKIAAEHLKFNSKQVDIMRTPPSIQRCWHNFSDIRDNVALNNKLSDDFSENDKGIKPIDHYVVNNYEVEGQKNPHKSYGYLRTPEFSNVLANFIKEDHLELGQKLKQIFYQVIQKTQDTFSNTEQEAF